MKKRTTLNRIALLTLLGVLAAFTLTACQSDNHEHPSTEHPKKGEPAK